MNDPLDELAIFHGEASTTLARVYARLPSSDVAVGCELTGCVVGPRCRWAQTLPAATPLVARPARGEADPLLSEAILPDPCFWSDELPTLYSVLVQLRRGGEVIATTERPIGLRGVGCRGRSLFQQGRRWVPRGACVSSLANGEEDDVAAWRAATAVMFVDRPSDAVCQSASEAGAWLMAGVDGNSATLESELSRLARYAAVFMALLPMETAVTRAMRLAAPNVLLAQQPAMAGDWATSAEADCVLLDATDVDAFAVAARGAKIPVIARRRLADSRALIDARRASDDLQRDLARLGDFAGYIV